MRILSPEQHALIADERRVLASLRDELVQLHASPDAKDALDQSIAQLDELFLLVVVGEFNAGKSAFINALLGQRVLKEGVTPTTAQVNVLQYGDEPERSVATAASARHHRARRSAPRHPHRRHAGHQRDHPRARGDHRRVRAALRPRALRHLGRPAVHRERARVPGAIRDWGKKIVVVVNKVDMLERDEAGARQSVASSREHAQPAARLRRRRSFR